MDPIIAYKIEEIKLDKNGNIIRESLRIANLFCFDLVTFNTFVLEKKGILFQLIKLSPLGQINDFVLKRSNLTEEICKQFGLCSDKFKEDRCWCKKSIKFTMMVA